jgi:arylformamidase
MRIFDVTHPITENMPVYPGTEAPVFQQANTLAKDGFIEQKITFYSHTGTHMDAPSHIFPAGKTLDDFPPSTFCGTALILDFSRIHSTRIEPTHLMPHAQNIAKSSFVLIHTGWSGFWGEQQYFSGFPVLTQEAAQWLMVFRLNGLGVDTISVDSVEETALPNHRIILGANTLVIENLANLSPLSGKMVQFFCLPLKLANAEGSPVRAIALLHE